MQILEREENKAQLGPAWEIALAVILVLLLAAVAGVVYYAFRRKRIQQDQQNIEDLERCMVPSMPSKPRSAYIPPRSSMKHDRKSRSAASLATTLVSYSPPIIGSEKIR